MRIGDITTGVPLSLNPIDDLQQLLQFQFMRSAFIAGTVAAVVAGIVGYFVVLRGLSFAAHTISQVGFAGATGSLALGIPALYGLLALNGVAAIVIGTAGLREKSRDVVVGIVQCCALGMGLLFLALSRAEEAVPVLVGDVLGISPGERTITEIAAVVVLVIVGGMYRPLLFSSLDGELAEARGVPVRAVSLSLMFVVAVTTSVATPIIGVLLTFALIVGPAAAAAQITARPSRAILVSVSLSVGYMWIGLTASYWVDLPPSVFVTSLAFAGYVIARLTHARSRGHRRGFSVHPEPAIL